MWNEKLSTIFLIVVCSTSASTSFLIYKNFFSFLVKWFLSISDKFCMINQTFTRIQFKTIAYWFHSTRLRLRETTISSAFLFMTKGTTNMEIVTRGLHLSILKLINSRKSDTVSHFSKTNRLGFSFVVFIGNLSIQWKVPILPLERNRCRIRISGTGYK